MNAAHVCRPAFRPRIHVPSIVVLPSSLRRWSFFVAPPQLSKAEWKPSRRKAVATTRERWRYRPAVCPLTCSSPSHRLRTVSAFAGPSITTMTEHWVAPSSGLPIVSGPPTVPERRSAQTTYSGSRTRQPCRLTQPSRRSTSDMLHMVETFKLSQSRNTATSMPERNSMSRTPTILPLAASLPSQLYCVSSAPTTLLYISSTTTRDNTCIYLTQRRDAPWSTTLLATTGLQSAITPERGISILRQGDHQWGVVPERGKEFIPLRQLQLLKVAKPPDSPCSGDSKHRCACCRLCLRGRRVDSRDVVPLQRWQSPTTPYPDQLPRHGASAGSGCT
ncbi:uncharacterized protein IWZ02DRAFT_268470 [Phyllosticta citriasiana]|uniref:Uncharacterized protein n=1 Tax=Phyllosticta citriasiana TaxID=595635 RepID=A0ABR1KU64_9PEZI